MESVEAEEVGSSVMHGRRRGPIDRNAGASVVSAGVASGWGDEPSGDSSTSVSGGDPVAQVNNDSVQIVKEQDEVSEAAERLAATVAEAPRNVAKRVATLRELERDKLAGADSLLAGASRADGTNLQILTSALYPSESLVEPDEVVDWDLTLQRITQEMFQEGEKSDELSEGKKDPMSPASASRRL